MKIRTNVSPFCVCLAQMPFLENIIKNVINHLKIDVNDIVNDSDSCLPSESSIRSPFTGDENDDFLALDRTPRVINGHVFVVRTYPGSRY